MVDTMEQAALRYHLEPRPGKLAIQPTKPLSNQQGPGAGILTLVLPMPVRPLRTITGLPRIIPPGVIW